MPLRKLYKINSWQVLMLLLVEGSPSNHSNVFFGEKRGQQSPSGDVCKTMSALSLLSIKLFEINLETGRNVSSTADF